jgi:acetoacetyl-CoA synthetase
LLSVSCRNIQDPQYLIIMSATTEVTTPRKLWQHQDPESTEMWKFMQKVNHKRGKNMQTFRDLYAWSVGDDRTQFWEDWWADAGLIYEGSWDEVR